MILQALYEYYQRKASDPKSDIAPEGWEWKEIPFLVVIDREGNFVRFEDTREADGKKKRAKRFLVPQGEKRSVGIKAFLLWDNIEYALGANPRSRGDIDKRKEAFKKRIVDAKINHEDVQSIIKFIDKQPVLQIEKVDDVQDLWNEMLDSNPFVTFKIDGSEAQVVCDILAKKRQVCCSDANVAKSVCSIKGDILEVARLHASIKGVQGTNTSGGSIVSFNLPAFNSFGKQQSYNASISEEVAFAYTTALNRLLGKDSQNKISIGDTTIIFWAQKTTDVVDLEATFSFFFNTSKDDPDRNVQAVKALYDSVYTGKMVYDDTHFYVLGLAPNAARISVRFWKMGTIREFAEKIVKHFEDFDIVHGKKEPDYLSLYQVLTATVLEHKMANVPPNLAGAVVVSVLDGTPYPQTLLQQCMRRIRAEQKITRARAAILKAYFNRFNRFHNTTKREVSMALDGENKDVGYLLGRLFAILERIQVQSVGGEGKLNSTIRDRFYGAFSTSPITVMPMLLKLKNHHIAKLESGKSFFENLISEVMDGLAPNQIPAHLTLEEQALFAIGYYHQRQKFFEKKEKEKEITTN